MKIVSWNCNGALRKKHDAIDRLEPDLLIVQECEDPERSTKAYQSWAGNYLWRGDDKNKGIGVFARSELALTRLEWQDDGLQLFLPCNVNDQFVLLAVWTKHANSPDFRYIGQLWKYMQLHKAEMEGERFLLCGDLNSNKCWDECDRWWNHTDVVREFDEIGIRSIYHNSTGEAQGVETRPTLYHRRNTSKPYYVDSMFASANFYNECQIDVGVPADWLDSSDHMPLMLTIIQ